MKNSPAHNNMNCLLLTLFLTVVCARLTIRSPFEAVVSRFDENYSSVFCEIENDDLAANGICVTLINTNTMEKLISNSCLGTTSMLSSFELQNVPVGEYKIVIESVVNSKGERVVQTQNTKEFVIYSHDGMIPLVQFSNNGDYLHRKRDRTLNKRVVELQFVTNYATGVGVVSIPYKIVPRFPASLVPSATAAAQLPQSTLSVLSTVRASFLSEFNICVDIFNSSLSDTSLPLPPPGGRRDPWATVCSALQLGIDSMDIFNIPVGSYDVEIYIQHKKFSGDGPRYYEADGPALQLTVSALHEQAPGSGQGSFHMHPVIVVRDGNNKEFGFDLLKSSGAVVAFEFDLEGYVGAVSQVQPCLTVFKLVAAGTKEVLVDFMCLDKAQRSASLSPIPEGDYEISLQLRMVATPFTLLGGSSSLMAAVRSMHELVPSYDWQRLHAWHTIPTGIISRLPVGQGGHKEAKIAEPWTLQLLLPKSKGKRRSRQHKIIDVKGPEGTRRMQSMECLTKSSFLRMSVSRTTAMAEIIEAAYKLCNIEHSAAGTDSGSHSGFHTHAHTHTPPEPHGCMYLTAAAGPDESGDTSRLVLAADLNATVESTDLFNMNHRMLHISESCLVPVFESDAEPTITPEKP